MAPSKFFLFLTTKGHQIDFFCFGCTGSHSDWTTKGTYVAASMPFQICVSWMFAIGWTPTRSTKVGSKAVASIYLTLKPFASWNAHFQQKMVWILFAIIQKVTYASLSMIGLTGIMITSSTSHQIWGIVLFSCRVLVTLSSFQVSMVSLTWVSSIRYLAQQHPTNF